MSLLLLVTLSLPPARSPSRLQLSSASARCETVASPTLCKVERVPAKRASASVASLEPLEQARAVKQVLASRATLRRQLLLGIDD